MQILFQKYTFRKIEIHKADDTKVFEILSMLNRDVVKWVAIAFVIAIPIAYFAMNKLSEL
jgi:putative ABC transport system permease protein